MPRREPGEPYYRVDSDEARSILDGDAEGTVVVDVRRDDEWITGHIIRRCAHSHRRFARPDRRGTQG